MKLPITIHVGPDNSDALDMFGGSMLTGEIGPIKLGKTVGIVYRKNDDGSAELVFSGDVEVDLKRLPDPNIYAVKVLPDGTVWAKLFAGDIRIAK